MVIHEHHTSLCFIFYYAVSNRIISQKINSGFFFIEMDIPKADGNKRLGNDRFNMTIKI